MRHTVMRTGSLAIWLVLALASPQQAQTPPPEAKLVYLNVMAVDSHGEPVTDLTSNELQITDEGKLQEILFLGHRDEKPEAASSLKPNQFSNRILGAPVHATVILFDLLNETVGERGKASSELVRYLQPLDAADDLYLYLLTTDGQLYPVRGLADAKRSESTAPWTAQIKPRLDAAIREAVYIRPPNHAPVSRVLEFPFRVLNILALELSRVPGRKNIVWVTGGGNALGWGLRPYAEYLARSGVAVYPVPQTLTDLDLDEFAGLTGGRPNRGEDIGAALKEARSDLRTGYQIGYFPPMDNWDGKLHRLRISCNRKGVRLQARTGYYAVKDRFENENSLALDAATSADFDAAEIGLCVTVSPDSRYPQIEHFKLHIEAGDIALPRQGTQYIAQLQISAVRYLGYGDHDSKISQLSPHYTAAERDQALKDGIEIKQDVKIDSTVGKIRFIVLDRGSNALGSITVPTKAAPQLP